MIALLKYSFLNNYLTNNLSAPSTGNLIIIIIIHDYEDDYDNW